MQLWKLTFNFQLYVGNRIKLTFTSVHSSLVFMTLYHQIDRHSSLNPRSLMQSSPAGSLKVPMAPQTRVGDVRSGLCKV